MRSFSSLACVGALCLIVAGCGSSGTATTSHPVPGGAAVSAPSSAPGYCRALTGSGPLLAVGKAMNELAANPHDRSARATLRKAATALRLAAMQAPRRQKTVLLSASKAIHGLAAHGLDQASRVEHALVRVGRRTERPCEFPVG
jgi:hypothetical protein